jgi:Ca2+-binding RTX toxin-like protein
MSSYSGTSANNTIYGALEKDNVFSNIGIGSDRVVGGNRKDVFLVSDLDASRDLFDGGAGVDQLNLAAFDKPVALTIRLGEGDQAGSITSAQLGAIPPLMPVAYGVLAELRNIEDVTGTVRSDTIFGNSQDNRLDGGDGNDSLLGGAGHDTLLGGDGNDTLRGGTGRNDVQGGVGNDRIIFTFDRPATAAERDVVSGGDGVDTLSFEGLGADFLGAVVSLSTEFAPEAPLGVPAQPASIDTGFVASIHRTSFGTERTTLEASITQVENVIGSHRADIIIGDRRGNELSGGADDDLISGETGADTLFGDAGDDTFESYGDQATDVIDGGTGIDTVTYARSDRSVIVTLREDGDTGSAAMLGPATGGTTVPSFVLEDQLVGIENIIGSNHTDRIQGNSADNHFKGLAGNDLLFGGGGDDILNGGSGQDDLTGGPGADIFRVWDLGVGTSADEIMDFVSGTDMIDLSGFFSHAPENHWSSSAEPAPDFISSGAFSGDGEAEVRIVQGNGVARVQLDFGDGVLGVNDVEIVVHGNVTLTDLLF